MSSLSDAELLTLVDDIDRRLAMEGVEPKARSIQTPRFVCREIGVMFQIGGSPDPEVARIVAAHKALYRNDDMQMGALHSGLSFFTDLFFVVNLPIIYGSVRANPLDWTDASDMQRRRIFRHSEDRDRFIAGIIDVVDAGACLGSFEGLATPEGDALRFFRMACYHGQAMAATLRHAFDYRGGIQAGLLCSEMAVKAALAKVGWSEDDMKTRIGHKLLKAVGELRPGGIFDCDRLEKSIRRLPDFVASRYDERRWTRLETITIAESSQQVLGEISRSLSGRSFRSMLVS